MTTTLARNWHSGRITAYSYICGLLRADEGASSNKNLEKTWTPTGENLENLEENLDTHQSAPNPCKICTHDRAARKPGHPLIPVDQS